MNKIIIGIHGLGNKPPKNLLTEWWKKSIREGLVAIQKPNYMLRFELVYWADLLHPAPLDPFEKDEENPLFLREPYTPSQPMILPDTTGLFRKRLFDYVENKLDSLFLRKDMSLNLKMVTNTVIRRYFKDLEAYYEDTVSDGELPTDSVRKSIQDKLISVLYKHRRNDIILLAHSMGSIIAYDVLVQKIPGVKVHTLVSLGSPLGFPVIISKIYSEQKVKKTEEKKVFTPDPIHHRWLNYSDEADTICLDRSLADDFEPNNSGVRAEDFRIYNDYAMGGKRNPHKIYGYLRTKELSTNLDFLYYQRRYKLTSKILELLNKILSRFLPT